LESPYRKFARDVIVIGVFNVLMAINGLLLLPLLTKSLGAHDYGILAQVNATKGLIIILAGLGLPNAMTRLLAALKIKQEIREQFYAVFLFESLITAVFSGILIIFAPFIADAFFSGATSIVRITGLIGFVWTLDGVCLIYFKAYRQMMKFAIFGLVSGYVEFGVIAYMVLNGHGLFGVVFAIFIIEGLYLLFLLYAIKSQIGLKIPDFSKLKQYLGLALPMFPADVSSWLLNLSDRFIIGYFLGAAAVGIYSASYGLAMLISWSSGILSFVLLPTLSRLYDEGRIDEIKILQSRSLEYFLALAIPFICGAAILSRAVLGFLSTPEIASGGWLVTPLVVSSITLLGIGNIIGQILIVAKKTKIMGRAGVIAALVSISLNVILVPRIGIKGAAISVLVVYLFTSAIYVYHSHKIVQLKIDGLFVLKSLGASAIMSLVVWWLNSAAILKTPLTVFTGIAVYGIAFILLKGFSKQRWLFFKGLLTRDKAE
jgi:O-antigen/teichoic acid export membrane protein